MLSGAEHDPGDAAPIAEYLRPRSHRLGTLTPFSAETRALRAVVWTREDLVDQRAVATNQLDACLEAFWPAAKAVFADLASPIALQFLARHPTPESAASLNERRMAGCSTKHGSCGRRRPAELLARLLAAPAGQTGTVKLETHRDAVLAMVKMLGALLAAIKDLDPSVSAHLGEHPDAEISTSLPPSGPINAAQVPAEWGDCRPAYADAEAVACPTGATPVTNQSGKHTAGQLRWACNKRVRRAICTVADNPRHGSPWAANLHADALARGHDHPHAVRIQTPAWTRVLWRCRIDQVPNDPANHGTTHKLTKMATPAV